MIVTIRECIACDSPVYGDFDEFDIVTCEECW
jgi:hypothetical protein